jgi:predicted Zn-dependent protease with MMP-like domain
MARFIDSMAKKGLIPALSQIEIGDKKPKKSYDRGTDPRKPGLGTNNMTSEQIAAISPEDMNKLTREEVESIPQAAINMMSPERKAKLKLKKELKNRSSQTKPGLGTKNMAPEQIAAISPEEMDKLSREEIENVPQAAIDMMSTEQKGKLEDLKKELKNRSSQTKPGLGTKNMAPEQIAAISPEEMDKLSREEIENMPQEALDMMSSEQKTKLEDLKKKTKNRSSQTRPGLGTQDMAPEQIAAIVTEDMDKLTREEIENIPQAAIDMMSTEQKAKVEELKKYMKDHPSQIKPGLGTKYMAPEQIAAISPEEMNKLSREEIENIPQAAIDMMSTEQKAKVEELKKYMKDHPSQIKPGLGTKHMAPEQIAAISPEEMDKLTREEIENIPQAAIDMMSTEQKAKVEKLKKYMKDHPSQIKPGLGTKDMTPEQIAAISPEEMDKLTREEIENIPQAAIDMMSTEQKEKFEELKNIPQAVLDEMALEEQERLEQYKKELGLLHIGSFENLDLKDVARIRLSTLDGLTPSQILKLSDEIKAQMTPEQLAKLDSILSAAGMHYGKQDVGEAFSAWEGDDQAQAAVHKKRKKPTPKRRRGQKTAPTGEDGELPDEKLEIPKPRLGEHLEIMTMEGYLASLRKEDLENMAASAVQKELQRQYAHLQSLQNQLAKDIQTKMEIIYQKLLREIITQQLSKLNR